MERGGKVMWRLPECLTLEVFARLELRDGAILARTSRELLAVFRSVECLEMLLWREGKVPSKFMREYGDVELTAEQRRKLLQAFNTQESAVIECYGFATSGGVDENDAYYWMRRVFCPDNKGYCARAAVTNVNIAGVLSVSQQLPAKETVLLALRDRLTLAVANMGDDGYRIRNLLEQSLDRYGTLVLYKLADGSLPLLQKPEEALDDTRAAIEEILRGTVTHTLDCSRLQRTQDDWDVLEERIQKPVFPECKVVACVTSLIVSRKGGFTCPVETLVVFASLSHIDVTAREFADYNDLMTMSDVETRISTHPGLPPVHKAETRDTHHYCEFRIQPDCALQPVVWLSFKGEGKRIVEVVVPLAQRFPMLYFYAKLISAEDRRGRRQTEPMNIDVKCIVPLGTLCVLE